MAKNFDLFLHRRLTECDLIIQSIPFRDGITVSDRMLLDAALQGCRLLRVASGRSDAELTARLDRMIKTCREKLRIPAVMDASVRLKETGLLSADSEPMELSAENLGTLAVVLNQAEAGMVMSVEPLVTRIAKSLGRMDTQIVSGADAIDTLKRSLITLRLGAAMDAGLKGDLKKGLLSDVNPSISMDASLDSLCSRVCFDAAAGFELTAMVLGIRMSRSLGRAVSGLAIDSEVMGTAAQKMEAANGVIQIMADMTPVLIKLIHPEARALLMDAGVAGSALKRYRLLEEMDNLTLEDFDNMMFNEVDYVISEE